MWKKLLLGFVLLIVLVVIGVFLPSNMLNVQSLIGLSGTGSLNSFAALEVYSLGGDMRVFIDGEEVGIVQESSGTFEFSPINQGAHTIKLERIASNDTFYPVFEREVEFTDGFTSVISWEIGPTDELSSGWILTAVDRANPEGITILSIDGKDSISATMNDETVLLPMNETEVSLGQPMVVTFSSEGTQSLTVELFGQDQDERKKLRNYELLMHVNLFEKPVLDVT